MLSQAPTEMVPKKCNPLRPYLFQGRCIIGEIFSFQIHAFIQGEPLAHKAVAGIRRVGIITIVGARPGYPLVVIRYSSIHIPYIACAKVNSNKGPVKFTVSGLRFHLKGESKYQQ